MSGETGRSPPWLCGGSQLLQARLPCRPPLLFVLTAFFESLCYIAHRLASLTRRQHAGIVHLHRRDPPSLLLRDQRLRRLRPLSSGRAAGRRREPAGSPWRICPCGVSPLLGGDEVLLKFLRAGYFSVAQAHAMEFLSKAPSTLLTYIIFIYISSSFLREPHTDRVTDLSCVCV
ncbi:hypothetical protein Taro_004171 [Colocasia esculenta]|uniref:Uncharacterized protein n=1 Tax=Colocasia esculenta TaxID=4460 RepID=A0A843TNP8_COLES|nr:hypothetical protein [Colocasia esculenta]